jgi:signal transduction histidine kinase
LRSSIVLRESELRRYLDNVMHATERAKLLVERILGFSRSGLGDRVPVNVESVVTEALELLEASLPAGIRLKSRIDTGNAAVIGDATDLHQIAMNLCTNALQAMEPGGLLNVVLERAEVNDPRTLSRGSLAPGPYVRLIVSDTGTGISLRRFSSGCSIPFLRPRTSAKAPVSDYP